MESAGLNPRVDEYELDFEDNRGFAVERWNEMVLTCEKSFEVADSERFHELQSGSITAIQINDLAMKTNDPISRKYLHKMQMLPRTLGDLLANFNRAISPQRVDSHVFWGLVTLNIELSLSKEETMDHTSDWLGRMRRSIELFTRVQRSCEEKQELLFAYIDLFDHIFSLTCISICHLRGKTILDHNTHSSITFQEKISHHLLEIGDIVKHLGLIASYSTANKSVKLTEATIGQPEELELNAAPMRPIIMLPDRRNESFFAREAEIARIDQNLKWDANSRLRTYTLYGRRGVGKTDLALEYAHKNPAKFDAIFWIRCETGLSLRQSFTNMATTLNISGAERTGHHEENRLSVLKWLKTSTAHWLMIFDNAEKESQDKLKGYWPLDSTGAILVTSRSYYNFTGDQNRKGETIRPFNMEQSWELMIRQLNKKWIDAYEGRKLDDIEVASAKAWLGKLGGLPLSINAAVGMINNSEKYGETTMLGMYEKFQLQETTLPLRKMVEQSSLIRNLDVLFAMSFAKLSNNAQAMLRVLSLLSADDAYIELFLPRNQNALSKKLAFAKQLAPVKGGCSDCSEDATQIYNITPALSDALCALRTANLIQWDHRIINVHRVVQEAMNYQSWEDLQESFESAVQLLHEAFPKRQTTGTLYPEWAVCNTYIYHAEILAKRFTDSQRPGSLTKLKPPWEFKELLANAAWYLYEIADYDMSCKLVNIAIAACGDTPSTQRASLLTIQGSNYFELNQLMKCRKSWEPALQIRRGLGPDLAKLDIAVSLQSMGNLELASGNPMKALENFQRSIRNHAQLNNNDNGLELAYAHLGLAMCYIVQSNYNEGHRALKKAEEFLGSKSIVPPHFLALQSFYKGNLEYSRMHYHTARSHFENCLHVALANIPIHPFAIAAHYKLGSSEFALGNHGLAEEMLRKALDAAELRSPGSDDGATARVLWKLGQLLRSDVSGGKSQEAERLLDRAFLAKSNLLDAGEVFHLTEINCGGGRSELEFDECSFDCLVPRYFR